MRWATTNFFCAVLWSLGLAASLAGAKTPCIEFFGRQIWQYANETISAETRADIDAIWTGRAKSPRLRANRLAELIATAVLEKLPAELRPKARQMFSEVAFMGTRDGSFYASIAADVQIQIMMPSRLENSYVYWAVVLHEWDHLLSIHANRGIRDGRQSFSPAEFYFWEHKAMSLEWLFLHQLPPSERAQALASLKNAGANPRAEALFSRILDAGQYNLAEFLRRQRAAGRYSRAAVREHMEMLQRYQF